MTENIVMKKYNVKKIALTGIFTGLAVVGSLISIPVLGAKCAPVQHVINIISAIILGPWYALSSAFLASLIRNILGIGTLLAFPGSMCGALLAGLLFKYSKKFVGAYIGELIGTSIIGGMLSYPIATMLMGNSTAALFTFVIPFLISSAGGTIIAVMIIVSLNKAGMIASIRRQLM
jgi:energy coupling factor transporter S component ThiW